MSAPATSNPTGAQIWPGLEEEESWITFLSWFFSGPRYERYFDETAAKNELRWFRKKGAHIAFRALSPEGAEKLKNVYRESLEKGLPLDTILSGFFFIGAEGQESTKTKVDF